MFIESFGSESHLLFEGLVKKKNKSSNVFQIKSL